VNGASGGASNLCNLCGVLKHSTWHHRLLSATLAGALALTISAATQAPATKRLLFLTHAGLYKHTSLGPAERAVSELGQAGGFEVTTHEGYKAEAAQIDLRFLTPEYLAQFDGLMLMTNGNLPLTDAQKKSLLDFVAQGNGFIGAHCAALTLYDYPGFGEMLGGYFRRSLRQNAIAVLKVEDQSHPATRMLGSSWPIVDEFYLFGSAPWDASRPKDNVDVLFGNRIPLGFSRDRVHVLLSLDTEKTDIARLPDVVRGGDYPQAWAREYGKGRSFYTSLGHRDDIWSNDPVFRAHITGGIRWALRLEN
jgi:type 1 glutamine amidotransferase